MKKNAKKIILGLAVIGAVICAYKHMTHDVQEKTNASDGQGGFAPTNEVAAVVASTNEVPVVDAPMVAPTNEVTEVVAPTNEVPVAVAPMIAPTNEVPVVDAPMVAPTNEVTEVVAPTNEVTEVVASTNEVPVVDAPMVAPTNEVTEVVAPTNMAQKVQGKQPAKKILFFNPPKQTLIQDRRVIDNSFVDSRTVDNRTIDVGVEDNRVVNNGVVDNRVFVMNLFQAESDKNQTGNDAQVANPQEYNSEMLGMIPTAALQMTGLSTNDLVELCAHMHNKRGGTKRWKELYWSQAKRGRDFGFADRRYQKRLAFQRDVLMICQTAVTRAKDSGSDCCWIKGVSINMTDGQLVSKLKYMIDAIEYKKRSIIMDGQPQLIERARPMPRRYGQRSRCYE